VIGELTLERPLVSIDVETTGVSYGRDRIVQIGMVNMPVDGAVREGMLYINPGMPIPPEATAVHHITDEMVRDAPKFSDIAERLYNTLSSADICGYNVAFDLRFITDEFARCNFQFKPNRVIDVFRIYQKYYPRTLVQAIKDYLEEEASDQAHDALFDARSSLRVLGGQLRKHPDLPRTVAELVEFLAEKRRPDYIDRTGKIAWRNGVAVVNFGKKHHGRPLREVPRDYLTWMLSAEFEEDTKDIIRRALEGRYPVKESDRVEG
jgi:DNA polymerase-3 subunit epsilon